MVCPEHWLLVAFWVVSFLPSSSNAKSSASVFIVFVTMSHSRATNSRSFLFCHLFRSPFSTDLLSMHRIGRTWTRPLGCGGCVGTTSCVLPIPFLHCSVPNSTSSPRRPPLLRSHPGCMCRAYASSTLPTTYISARYITSRFSCAFCYRSDLKFDHTSHCVPLHLGIISANPGTTSPAPLYSHRGCSVAMCCPTSATQTTERRWSTIDYKT